MSSGSVEVQVGDSINRPETPESEQISHCGIAVPEVRPMGAGEEYLIESGASAVVVLPNGSEGEISAG